MIQNATCILQLHQIQAQCLHLQLIACDVVLQRHALLVLLAYVVNEFLGECNVAFKYLLAMGNLLQVEILTQCHKTLVLLVQSHSKCGLLYTQFCHFYACINGASGIDSLLGVHHKLITKVGRRQVLPVAKVTIRHQRVANIAGAELGVHVGQSITLSSLYALLGSSHCGATGLNTLVVFANQLKQLVDIHLSDGLSLSRYCCGECYRQHHKNLLFHTFLDFGCNDGANRTQSSLLELLRCSPSSQIFCKGTAIF